MWVDEQVDTRVRMQTHQSEQAAGGKEQCE
jgi:hypothetical protein